MEYILNYQLRFEYEDFIDEKSNEWSIINKTTDNCDQYLYLPFGCVSIYILSKFSNHAHL